MRQRRARAELADRIRPVVRGVLADGLANVGGTADGVAQVVRHLVRLSQPVAEGAPGIGIGAGRDGAGHRRADEERAGLGAVVGAHVDVRLDLPGLAGDDAHGQAHRIGHRGDEPGHPGRRFHRLQRDRLEGEDDQRVARQQRNSTESKDFYIDLVFYNYLLKCFVLFDLKTDELTHQDIGQMDMYVRLYDDQRRGPDDNPTVGIILCANKDETVVRYSVLHGNEKLFATKYKLILPSEAELREELERELEGFRQQKLLQDAPPPPES